MPKLINCEYDLNITRRRIVGGLKGYEMKLSGSLVSGTEVTVAKEREDGEGVNLTPSKLTTSSALEEFQKRKQKKT